jgi:hypothetical protein
MGISEYTSEFACDMQEGRSRHTSSLKKLHASLSFVSKLPQHPSGVKSKPTFGSNARPPPQFFFFVFFLLPSAKEHMHHGGRRNNVTYVHFTCGFKNNEKKVLIYKDSGFGPF